MDKFIEYKYYYWGPFLYKTQITPDECQKLLKEGKKCRKKSNDFRSTLAGHLSEEYKLENKKDFNKWFEKYLTSYVNGYQNWKGDLNKLSQTNLILDDIWINYMKNKDFNPPHTHKADLSFVVYPSIPDKIIEENKNFLGTRNPGGGPGSISFSYALNMNKHYVSTVDHLPQTGDLFIFPADLTHWVYPFKSEVERVSVSGNLFFTGSDK